ncbi:hypothetical protein HY640_02105 [Candidatus Woesearchaeota archaeon]|nr:hypothetical protein [Candidatus Woesearchaeota archaeon]
MAFLNRRGQAAMEFLMTYGWAILVVLIVIGALAYFGILSPDTLLPEKCTLPVQMSCKDHRITDTVVAGSDSFRLELQNGAGKDILLRNVNVTSSDGITAQACNMSGTVVGNGITVRNGQSVSVTVGGGTPAEQDVTPVGGVGEIILPCTLLDTGRAKNRYGIVVTYSWLDSQAIVHTLDGELLAKIEK